MTERTEQMTKAWEEVGLWLSAFPQNMFCQLCYDEETREVKLKSDSLNDGPVERGDAFDKFSRKMSLDSMVQFFNGFARDERKRQGDRKLRKIKNRKLFKSGSVAEILAGLSQAPKAAAPNYTSHSFHRTASNKPKPS